VSTTAGLSPRPAAEADPVARQLSPSPRRSAEIQPLSPDRYKDQLTIGGSTLEKLRLAKDMLRHALPSGDDEAILDRALTALLTDLARKKFGAEPKAGASPNDEPASEDGTRDMPAATLDNAADTRHIPTDVKRTVWVRDLGRCAFAAPDGHRCGERAFVEFHHVRPWAVGGRPTVENIQLRCRRHNRHEARVFFDREPESGDTFHEPAPAAETGSPFVAAADPRRVSRGPEEPTGRRSGTATSDGGPVPEPRVLSAAIHCAAGCSARSLRMR
jgi:hypothetical protein